MFCFFTSMLQVILYVLRGKNTCFVFLLSSVLQVILYVLRGKNTCFVFLLSSVLQVILYVLRGKNTCFVFLLSSVLQVILYVLRGKNTCFVFLLTSQYQSVVVTIIIHVNVATTLHDSKKIYSLITKFSNNRMYLSAYVSVYFSSNIHWQFLPLFFHPFHSIFTSLLSPISLVKPLLP